MTVTNKPDVAGPTASTDNRPDITGATAATSFLLGALLTVYSAVTGPNPNIAIAIGGGLLAVCAAGFIALGANPEGYTKFLKRISAKVHGEINWAKAAGATGSLANVFLTGNAVINLGLGTIFHTLNIPQVGAYLSLALANGVFWGTGNYGNLESGRRMARAEASPWVTTARAHALLSVGASAGVAGAAAFFNDGMLGVIAGFFAVDAFIRTSKTVKSMKDLTIGIGETGQVLRNVWGPVIGQPPQPFASTP